MSDQDIDPKVGATADQDIELQKLAIEHAKVRLDSRKTAVAFWSVIIALLTSFGSLWLSMSQSRSTEARERLDMLQRKFEDVQKQIASTDPVVKIAAIESLSFLGRERLAGSPKPGTDDEIADVPYFRQCSKMLSVVALVDKDPLVRDAAVQSGLDLEKFVEANKLARLAELSYEQWYDALHQAQDRYDALLLEYCHRHGVSWIRPRIGPIIGPKQKALNELMDTLLDFRSQSDVIPYFELTQILAYRIPDRSYEKRMLSTYLKSIAVSHIPEDHFNFDLTELKDNEILKQLLDGASVRVGVRSVFIKLLPMARQFSTGHRFRVIQVDFSGLSLSGTDLTGVEFLGCQFISASFSDKMSDVDFTSCLLDGARFQDAQFKDVTLSGCTLESAEFFRCDPETPTLERCEGKYKVSDTP